MSDLSLPAQDSITAQAELFRRAAKESQLTIPAIAARSGIPTPTLRGWAKRTAMPAWAIGALGSAGIPDHLLSLVTEPWQRCVVTEEDGDGDLDTAAVEAGDFAHEVQKAHHPDSPGGLAIVPQERVIIVPKLQRAKAAMQRAA